MNFKTISFPGISVTVPENWEDITDQVNAPEAPFSIAEPARGVGAVQFSAAIYKSGQLPNPTVDDLGEMLHEFAARHQLGSGFADSSRCGDTLIVGKSFRSGDDYYRIWFVSDGRSFVLATYTCDWESRGVEEVEREQIVHSMQISY
jgi:hypothetical protein